MMDKEYLQTLTPYWGLGSDIYVHSYTEVRNGHEELKYRSYLYIKEEDINLSLKECYRIAVVNCTGTLVVTNCTKILIIGSDLKAIYGRWENKSIDQRSYVEIIDSRVGKLVNRDYMNIQNLSGSKVPFVESRAGTLRRLGEPHPEGFVFYKIFNYMYPCPDHWVLEKDSVIEEVVDNNGVRGCSYGINVATLDWVQAQMQCVPNTGQKIEVWKVLIEYPDLVDVCIPFRTEGKIRAGRVRLLERIDE